MRPMRLDMAGFTVFREETTVDFTDADFFALVGPTGSGKSTVLDAICFALYGTVPRWGGTRGLANALAPSANEARVRLVFESAGARYVATRVVRRDGRGTVKTANAGLQLMPAGFDVTKLDTGLSPEDLGEVVAGTPAEMERAVLEAVGLPYEQFTSCVLLPQGQFADFLHAKPATRQQILVNLLGLGVYEEVQKRAVERAGHLRANNFERWLLAEALDLLVDGASRILRELSNGQYDLVHDKGEFFVVDHHDAGLRRAVRTLSGGETFQASLALALALSEQLAGMSTTAASLESIVLDEGFGTLDAATLDTVAATLENLAARGDRMVGVVTHVPALADRIPVRFEVRKDARTARVERTGL
ncbi:AAA family ATPase [Micromonospora globispora]|uniref:AAA family ATPase n=1 Tax=Micromonospora globispora TaxID=1450148 RepID=UPI000F5DF2EB|nr:AAA family ATPase [Micromonospora globispora]RQW96818.1 hypothetical protein DKL51_12865 [Micromonospora globispora]